MGCVARGCTGQPLSLFCYANAEWLEAFCRAALPNLTAPSRRRGVRHTLGILHTGHGVSSLQHHLTFHLYSFLMNTAQQYMWKQAGFVIICCEDERYFMHMWTVFSVGMYGRKKIVYSHLDISFTFLVLSWRCSLCAYTVFKLGGQHVLFKWGALGTIKFFYS